MKLNYIKAGKIKNVGFCKFCGEKTQQGKGISTGTNHEKGYEYHVSCLISGLDRGDKRQYYRYMKGVVTPEKTERNQELIADYNGGMKYVDLVVKYDINTARIFEILKSHKVEKNRQGKNKRG